MKMNVKSWSLIAGWMDASTGLMLIFAPKLSLYVMKIPPLDPASLVFLQWIGAFVGSVGLSYLFALRSEQDRVVVWKITALIRFIIAAFVVVMIAQGKLIPSWWNVAATDFIIALVQILWLRSEKKEAVA
jgi:hypothetical protein